MFQMIECILTYLSSNPHGSEDISVFSAETKLDNLLSGIGNFIVAEIINYSDLSPFYHYENISTLSTNQSAVMLELDQSDHFLLIIQICHQVNL